MPIWSGGNRADPDEAGCRRPSHDLLLANDLPFALGAAVFGGDEAKAREIADRLEVGMVGINARSKSAPDMPFGGVKTPGGRPSTIVSPGGGPEV